MDEPVLELKGIMLHRQAGRGFFGLGPRRGAPALLDLSLKLAAGETLGLIGESGAGKSTLALTLSGRSRPERGEIRFDGVDLARLSGRALQVRVRRLQLLSQEAGECFDRERSVGKQLAEELTRRRLAEGAAGARRRLAEAFAAVELAPGLLQRSPRELSGGELQRVALARIVALNPRVVVLDEPLAGVDPQLRERLLTLLRRLQTERQYAYLFISHDYSQIRRMAQRVAVIYRGRIVEIGPTVAVLDRPLHPHVRALLAPEAGRGPDPVPDGQLQGCAYHLLCPVADRDRCCRESPVLRPVEPRRWAACHLL